MNQEDWNGNSDRDTQIESMMAQLSVEKAPASLTRRLMRIPREERRKARRGSWWPSPNDAPRWVLAPAFAAVPLLVLAVFLMRESGPSQTEVEQARQDLAIAFAYIDRAGFRTGEEIQSALGGELRHTVKGNLSKHIPFTEQSHKEDTT